MLACVGAAPGAVWLEGEVRGSASMLHLQSKCIVIIMSLGLDQWYTQWEGEVNRPLSLPVFPERLFPSQSRNLT